jgi:hypothetical protein
VHPLIIIRLLEHRLFTPMLKKTTNPRATPSVSLSMAGAYSNATAGSTPTSVHPQSIAVGGVGVNGSGGASTASNIFLKTSPSTSFPPVADISHHHKKSLQCGGSPMNASSSSAAARRKCSEGYYNVRPNEFDTEHVPTQQRKHSQASIFFFRVGFAVCFFLQWCSGVPLNGFSWKKPQFS